MTTWRARRRRVLDWLADDDHGLPALEAYAIAALAFGAIVFGIVGNLPDGLYQTASLACLGFLVLSTVRQRAAQGFTIADVLRDRDSYEGFARLLDGASELGFYAPSGVNVLPQHLPDVKRWVQGGGRVILELHGFQDAKVGDRMHLEIRRSESVHWFDYWAGGGSRPCGSPRASPDQAVG